MEVATQWRVLRDLGPWFVVQALLPGATLFALLVWLSYRFVHEGFGEIRRYSFGPAAGTPFASSERRNWWSCTCGTVVACRCLAAMERGLRRCCAKLLELPPVLLASAR
jgi:heme A synthase